MHQQPPKTPLLRSTNSANAGHVDSSKALTVYAFNDATYTRSPGSLGRCHVSTAARPTAPPSTPVTDTRTSPRIGNELTIAIRPGGIMKLLLTSSGIRNASIHDALVDLLGKPIAESTALCNPTGCSRSPTDLHTSTGSSTDRAAAPCAAWLGNRWGRWSSPRCPASKRSTGFRRSGSRRSGSGRSPFCISATGCGSPDWPTSCRHYGARRLRRHERRCHGR